MNIIVYSGIKMQYHFPEKRQIRLFEILRECQSRECKSAHMSMSLHNLNAKRAISRQKQISNNKYNKFISLILRIK